ncbi:uncharacterized protein LOC109718446 isoform X1 [Ananas comosus]|uniref:Uncharacterized protein LOC109718446 isoform X1 n=1 Tax=Ananas comosus TaxID=4615 RepID=A0A6P5FX96_ANACO|nr:uncharacterized protein LOC109718446 isoform X1 [Ananas comosus]
MHRSSSAARTSDEYSSPAAAAAAAAAKGGGGGGSFAVSDQLPTYDPRSHAGRKEAARARFAEDAVHAIPVVLVLCAFLLWLSSDPEVVMVNKDHPVVARIKNMTNN